MQRVQSDTQLVEDRRPLAEDRVNLDQLLIGGDQGADASALGVDDALPKCPSV